MSRPSQLPLVGLAAIVTAALVAVVMTVTVGSRAAFLDTTDNVGSYFEARACFPGSATYDFAGVTSPSSTHTAEDGEIDQSDTVITNGTFSARRNTIGGWANWGEATTAEYSNLVGSDNLYYQGADPGPGDNAAMIFEFTVSEDTSCITQIDVNVEGAQGGVPGADEWFVYLWDYSTSTYLVGGSMNGTSDQVVSFSVTSSPANHVQTSDGQLTVFVVNKDVSDWIRVDDITVTVSQAATAAVTGTVVPSTTEAAVVAGAETIVITLTNDTWDVTIGADNAKTTALINGIDSAQAEATGWDAVVKANMDFNDVTRSSDTVVTITLGAEPTYDITADETITVTVPATAVASGSPIAASPTFDVFPDCVAGNTGFLSPTAEAATTGGDGDGFELNPTNAFADDAAFASNIDGASDRHLFYNYGFSIPSACAIRGIEVRLDWYLDDIATANNMRVWLSWDGGTSLTTALRRDTVETTTEHTTVLGSPVDRWERSWTLAELNDANFRVRLRSGSGDPFRDFFLDWVPVSVHYGDAIQTTGFLSPSAEAAVTSGSGDNDGFEVTPTNAFADGGGSAQDVDGGTASSGSCTNTLRDRHQFYNYGFSIPSGSAIHGIEVRLDAWADKASNEPRMCVELSWDGGTSWTAWQRTGNLTTTEATYIEGAEADDWGRTWSDAEFSDANFRVRITNRANSTVRDFFLDWLPVQVYYTPP